MCIVVPTRTAPTRIALISTSVTDLVFDNRFVAELPGDPDPSPNRREVTGAAWSAALPTPVAAPRLLAHAREVAALVGFSEDDVAAPAFADVFGGNALLPGMQPYAAVYGGHQFGHWAGQLGDGRAITLGEVVNASGERWELQLKGAGPTPFSRRADGRAVLRSSIREFLCSEAMHHLGVPTTRALSLVATGEDVVRDMFYDGNSRLEPGAVVCRVAPSFVRFGTFELPTVRGDTALLERLVDVTIDRDFPHLAGIADATEQRAEWFGEVCERTARMVVEWMRVGFVHGVMNTDNMSILGLTIDYGPYGWIENYDPTWTPNTTDAQGRRYRFGQQPVIAQWNLTRLGAALVPLFGTPDALQEGLDRYVAVYTDAHAAMTAAKFGLDIGNPASAPLAREGLEVIHAAEADHTLFFRALGEIPDTLPEGPGVRTEALDLLGDVFYDPARLDAQRAALTDWLRRWHAMTTAGGESAAARRARMHAVNPRYVLRNWLAQTAIDQAEAGDVSMVHTLLDVLRRPYDDQPEHAAFAVKRPEWARHRAGSSMLSCSS